jgi:hypothetical protein
MARKSKDQRISDTRTAIPRWQAAGRDREVRFMEDMIDRLEHGQGLSPRQRSWLDELAATEPPPPPEKNLGLIARCQAAVEHLGQRDASIVRDFVGRLNRGWKLSDKQTTFLESLLQKAETLAKDGPWQPSPEQLAEGVFAAQVVVSRGSHWKGTHMGVTTAAHRILSTHGVEARPTELEPADEWCFEKVTGSVGPAVREFRQPKFHVGEMVEMAVWPIAAGHPGCPGIITSGPVAHAGAVGYELFADGQPVTILSKHLKRLK